MKDVTQLLNRYRECVRHLWNTYFFEAAFSNTDWDLADEYEEICGQLFSALVLNQVDRRTHRKARAFEQSPQPLSFFRVVPSATSGVPIHINREKKASPYWDQQMTFIKPDEVDLRFIDFFDFGRLDFRELEYCRVRIVTSTANTDLADHDALLECQHVVVLFDDAVL
ncbi:MAG: hypothetical protein FJ147_25850 [Deltaproteobacteria bacterium]|nr:hypothetical protein [Deltaproteobacteria bacterium]